MRRLTSTLLSLVLVGASSAPASASITRLLSLGVDNWQVHDSANFWSNPALLKDIPDAVHFELGTHTACAGAGCLSAVDGGSQWGGVHKSWGRHVFAIYVRRPYGVGDFSAKANPLLLPGLGGLVAAQSVFGVTGLDTGGFFGTGPFETTANSVLSIDGAGVPNSDLDIANPSNFFDFLWAMQAGPFSMGLRFNYARNAPSEVRSRSFSNVGANDGSDEGTVSLERVTNEYNIQPAFSIRGDKARWDVVGQVVIPKFSVDYLETNATDNTSFRVRIDDDSTLGGSIASQLTLRAGENDSLAFRMRFGDHNVAGSASLSCTDAGLCGSATLLQSASFDNRRRYAGADITWNHLFEKALIITSIGYTRSQIKQTWNFADNNGGVSQNDLVKTDRDVVPLRIGMEIKPWEKIAIRAGIQKNLFAEADTVKRDGDGGVLVSDQSESLIGAEADGTANGVGLSLGLGIRLLSNLTIDVVLRQTVLFDGPNFIGGKENGVFAQGSLVYRFGLSSNNDDTLKPLLAYDEIQLY